MAAFPRLFGRSMGNSSRSEKTPPTGWLSADHKIQPFSMKWKSTAVLLLFTCFVPCYAVLQYRY